MSDNFVPPPPSGDPVKTGQSVPPTQAVPPVEPVQPDLPPPTGMPVPDAAAQSVTLPDTPVQTVPVPGTPMEPMPASVAPTSDVPMQPLPVQDAAAPYTPPPPAGTPTTPVSPLQQSATAVPIPPSNATPSMGYDTPPEPPAPPKKRSKKPLIITLIAVAVVALVVAGVLIFQEVSRSNAYDQASAAYDSGDYGTARDVFRDLGDYRDSADRLILSEDNYTYQQAIASFDAGDYEAARSGFESVRYAGFDDIDIWIAEIDLAEGIEHFDAGDYDSARSHFLLAALYTDVSEWIDKLDYIDAEELLAAGDVEGAYYAFLDLGNYSDAAARATACTQPFPGTGIIFQADGSYYAYAALDINYNYASRASFYKIYRDGVLVASVFMNGISTARVYLQPGNYTIKEGTGDVWFGPDLAFGKEGSYSTMTFDDAGTDFFTLNDGSLMTLTVNTSEAGNVGERGEDLSSF